jgi:hypothetical protein
VGRGGVGRGWGLGPPNLDEGLTPMHARKYAAMHLQSIFNRKKFTVS